MITVLVTVIIGPLVIAVVVIGVYAVIGAFVAGFFS